MRTHDIGRDNDATHQWFSISVIDWIKTLLNKHPHILDEIETHSRQCAESPHYLSPASGTVYRDHALFKSGKAFAVSLYFDFAVTTANLLGAAAKGSRNFGILIAQISNVPSLFLKDEGMLVLSVIPKTVFESIGWNKFVEPHVRDFQLLAEGIFIDI